VTFDDWTATGGIVPWGHVGGDAIDVMNGMDGAKIAVVVDVSGHGVAAALLAASVCSTLRRLVKARPLVESLLELEAELSASNSSGKYACVAAVERRGDVVTIVNAGLPPVAILRGGGVVESVVASGAPLGLLPDPSFEPTHIQTLRGDRIVLMSDGLTEPFGLADDLSSCIESLQLADPTWPLAPPAVLVREIVGLFGPGSPQTDDATLLVLERR
jgi:sigma-B regulation protein RsbU (phosphoserine phosphatase)